MREGQLPPDAMNRFKRAIRMDKPDSIPRVSDDSPNDDGLQASMNRHPSGSNDILGGWARALQGEADEVDSETDNVYGLDEARQPQPDTVDVMGRFVVGEAGGDRDRQMEVATDLVKVTRPLHEFVEGYVNESNVADFREVLNCIIDEKLMQNNDKQGE